MKIIDAHMHYSNIASFRECGLLTSEVDYSAQGYLAEAGACGIVRSICMGLSERPPSEFPDIGAETPMQADLSDELPPEILLCLGINPHTLTPGAIEQMDKIIHDNIDNANVRRVSRIDKDARNVRIVGIKIYAGYYHYDVNDPIYAPAFDFAQRHNLPVAIHSGDTYSEKGKLIYAQALSIDNLAVDRPDMRIIICHMGAPWIFDGCEVAGKNANVYMDLSGLLVGNAAFFNSMLQKPLILDRYRQAIQMLDNYDKLLFGTDWPLAPMASYIKFCKELVPPETYDKVFYGNAARVYSL